MEENDVREQFKKEAETELSSLIETYFDSDFTFEEFEKALADDKVDIDQIITGLYDNLYLHNRYTGYDFYYDDEDFECFHHIGDDVTSIFDYICNEWDNLK